MENNLKKLRKVKGISQGDLAHHLEVSRQTINSIENGKFDPSLTLTIKLTRFFEASLEEFIARDAVGLLRYNYNNFLG